MPSPSKPGWRMNATRRGSRSFFYLPAAGRPAYSPELHLDEYLTCDLKAGAHSKPPARDANQLGKKVRSQMKTFQKSPDLVQKYFKHPRIAYAA